MPIAVLSLEECLQGVHYMILPTNLHANCVKYPNETFVVMPKENYDNVYSLFFKVIGFFFPLFLYHTFTKKSRHDIKSKLSGKVVVITGASSGLGEALAHCLYKQGCQVILAARRINELNRVKQDLLSLKIEGPNYPPYILQLDLADTKSLEGCVKKMYEKFANIDILINNGGISQRSDILSTSLEVDTTLMNVNYMGPVALTKAILPKMVELKAGHVVFVSSLQGRIAIPYRSSYGASKHALQAFADSLRAEVNKYGIKVSVISPGYIQTSLSLNALTASGNTYGIMDSTTASGYSAEYVANQIMDMMICNTNEIVLCPFIHRIAIFLRFFSPSIYFWIMARRAKNIEHIKSN